MTKILSALKIKLMTLNRTPAAPAKKFILLLCPLYLSSCHDFRPIEPLEKIPLPKHYLNFFDTCYPSEGGGRVQWFKDKAPVAEARLDWLADNKKIWQTQLSDPFGMILLDLKWAQYPPSFSQSGKFKARLPQIKVNKEGFWEANGVMLGLKAEEIPCILKGKFPRSWRDMVYKKERNQSKNILYISEQSRKIYITFKEPKGKLTEACALFQWNQFLGIKTGEVNWCINQSNIASRLDLPEEQTLRWEKSDA